jgi:hypothetical protein
VGGLVIDWDSLDYATAYDVFLSDDGNEWTPAYSVGHGNGHRDYVPMHDREGRFFRLDLKTSSRGRGYCIRRLAFQGPGFSDSPNDLFRRIASDAPPGYFPKYYRDRQSYWTIMGVSGDSKKALMNEEGQVEIEKGGFSVEPFLYIDNRLVTWSDVTTTQDLLDGYIPFPQVTWTSSDGWVFTIQGTAAGPAGNSLLGIHYTLTAKRTLGKGKIFIAVRPFQVNPPWQSLNGEGGASRIDSIVYSKGFLGVNNTTIVPMTAPSAFGAAEFDEGDVTDFIARGAVPPSIIARDHSGYASGALEYDFDLQADGTADVVVAVPFHGWRRSPTRTDGTILLSSIIWESSSLTSDKFIPYVVENFYHICITESGRELIARMLNKSKNKAAIPFTQLASDNFADFCSTDDGIFVLQFIINENKSAAAVFMQPAAEFFSQLCSSYRGIELLETILEYNNNEAIELLEPLAQARKADAVLNSIRMFRVTSKILPSSSTQTEIHFNHLRKHNERRIREFCEADPELFANMIQNVVDIEKQEQEQGRYTFVHGYPWSYHLLQEIDTQLRSLVNGNQSQKISLRFFSPEAEKLYSITQEVEKRRILLEHGTPNYYAWVKDYQERMIFMNWALTCNQAGSNTLQYIAYDRCENPIAFSIENIFTTLGLEKYYDLYEIELLNLKYLHTKASKHGAGLIFSFTPEMLKKTVYVCYGSGAKRPVDIQGIGETDDVQLILDTLRTSPEKIDDCDHLEFVYILTGDCALNSEVLASDAVRYIPFNAADKEKMALYEQTRNELLARICDHIMSDKGITKKLSRY